MKNCLFIIIAMTTPNIGWCGDVVPNGYKSVASAHGIPHDLFYAVALTESGKQVASLSIHRPWPWTLNIAGQGHYYDSRQEAWQALTDHLQQGKTSIDIGLMQINWRYHQKHLGSPWLALDPYHNLRVAAVILKDCYRNRQDWLASVGCYHAPANNSRANRYSQRVASHLRRITAVGQG